MRHEVIEMVCAHVSQSNRKVFNVMFCKDIYEKHEIGQIFATKSNKLSSNLFCIDHTLLSFNYLLGQMKKGFPYKAFSKIIIPTRWTFLIFDL